jgi:hypothetical protein
MNQATWDLMKPIAAQGLRDALRIVGMYFLTHGAIQNGAGVEAFIGAGMTMGGLFWGWFTTTGYLKVAGLLKKLTDTKTQAAAVAVAKEMPPAIVTGAATEAKNTVAVTAATVVKILLVAFVLSAFLANGSAQAQAPKLTGNIVRDIQTAKGGTDSPALTGNPSKDLIALYGKLQAVSLVDLKYALNIANKKNNLAAGQCWTAIITQIEQDQTANLDANGQPLPTPDPHLFTDVERLSDVINSLGPNSPLMVGCGSFANQAKMNVLQLISTIMAGGAGLAALAP